MRALLALVLGLGLLWGGYWFVGASALQNAAEDWFAAQGPQGRIASRDSLVVRGFPNRFDLTITGLDLADPASGYGWQAPFVQLFSLSYQPWHIIAAFANEQRISTPFEAITLISDHLQASLVVHPGPALALNRSTLIGAGLKLRSSLGWQLAADQARFATRQDQTQTNAHEIGFEISGLTPDPALVEVLAGRYRMPDRIDLARLDAVAVFSAPLDRHAGETHPRLTALTIREGLIRWGNLVVFAKGSIRPDSQGRAEGRIDLRVENWRAALGAAITVGLIGPELGPTLEQVLALLAAQAGHPEVVELPLAFQSGFMSLGPIPLGAAPQIN